MCIFQISPKKYITQQHEAETEPTVTFADFAQFPPEVNSENVRSHGAFQVYRKPGILANSLKLHY